MFMQAIFVVADIWKGIMHNKCNSTSKLFAPTGPVTDITDGLLYRELLGNGKFLLNSTNITATFNTDGICLYSSSKIELVLHRGAFGATNHKSIL